MRVVGFQAQVFQDLPLGAWAQPWGSGGPVKGQWARAFSGLFRKIWLSHPEVSSKCPVENKLAGYFKITNLYALGLRKPTSRNLVFI